MIRTDRLEPFLTDLPQQEAALVSAASTLVPTLAALAPEADALRLLPEESVKAMRAAGLFRLATPRVHGGEQAGSRAVTAIAAEIARGCPSAAWVLTVFYSGGLAVWMFPEDVRRKVWQENPDATVCGSSGGGAQARPVEGGFLISGRWGWASGSHHADWIVLDVVGQSATDRGLALVPLSDLSIEQTWHMAGMCGTGSDTVVATDVFVPRDQVLFLAQMATAAAGTTLPRPQGLDSTLAGTPLGIGLAMYDLVTEKLAQGRKIDNLGVQAAVADAATLIDDAILQAARSARAVDRATRTGERLTPLQESRVRMDAGLAARKIRSAVDTLLDVGGASLFALSSPAQRLWRDLATATRHPAFVQEISRERYAHLLLDLG